MAHVFLSLFTLGPSPRSAQASPGARISGGLGVVLEPSRDHAVSATGAMSAVEAAALIPGGSAHDWEAGVRAAIRESSHEIAGFAGARVKLGFEDDLFVPYLRGGLRAGHGRGYGPIFGPHFGIGLEVDVLAIELVGHATISPPLRTTIALQVAVLAF